LLLDLGIGFTNVVARTTRGLADLSRAEISEGAKLLRQKMAEFRPKIAVFNGKAIYEVYSGQKKFMFGKQNDKMEGTDTWVWVMPNSSARCAQLPRAVDKVIIGVLVHFRYPIAVKSAHYSCTTNYCVKSLKSATAFSTPFLFF
jgi:mismatch-specific thymine-DNA glycosylase